LITCHIFNPSDSGFIEATVIELFYQQLSTVDPYIEVLLVKKFRIF